MVSNRVDTRRCDVGFSVPGGPTTVVDLGGRGFLMDPTFDKPGPHDYLKRMVDRRSARTLIDDRPEVDTNNGQATWRHIVFDQPYNKHSPAALRIRGWDDPHLEDILEAARRYSSREQAR
jgi:hypothetical protein